MKILLENVNLASTSGPNHFALKLVKELIKKDIIINPKESPDAKLCFIESRQNKKEKVPLIQRLDGIYFNKSQNYKVQNHNIQKTYNISDGVIFQSHFNKALTERYFGKHDNSTVIHNGADMQMIDATGPLTHSKIDKYENVWSCASSWRPHKRIDDNIRYFLEHAGKNDCLIVAGQKSLSRWSDFVEDNLYKKENIFYVGNVSVDKLISIYKRSKYFLHLAWLDHCPNVVVDARASGCQIICTSAGGTKEIAGEDAIVIEEQTWDYNPIELYSPPKLDFSNKIFKNPYNKAYNIDISNVANKYLDFISWNAESSHSNTDKDKQSETSRQEH